MGLFDVITRVTSHVLKKKKKLESCSGLRKSQQDKRGGYEKERGRSDVQTEGTDLSNLIRNHFIGHTHTKREWLPEFDW